MRIVAVFPWSAGSLSEAEEAHREGLVAAAASPGTEVDFVRIEQASILSEPFSGRNTSRVIDEVVAAIERAAPTGPDAFIVWGGLDPGVAPARQRVDVPVIGVAQATYAAAAQLGMRLGLVVYEAAIVEAIWAGARACGAEHLVASVRPIDVPMPDLTPRRAHVRERIVEEARAALTQDGAQAIYVNGMSMMPAAIGAEDLSDQLGAPVLDPLRIGMRTAELVVGTAGLGAGRRRAR
jgi:allantoin racemase